MEMAIIKVRLTTDHFVEFGSFLLLEVPSYHFLVCSTDIVVSLSEDRPAAGGGDWCFGSWH